MVLPSGNKNNYFQDHRNFRKMWHIFEELLGERGSVLSVKLCGMELLWFL